MLSWNILAQHLFDSTGKWYTHVSPNDPIVHNWDKRWIAIQNEIQSSKADIICLQEVEFDAFDDDILPALQSLGYDGMMQNAKSRKRGHGYGVATFWKSDRFQLRDVSHHSRTMLTTLEDTDTYDHDNCNNEVTAVLNCHLEGAPKKSVVRVRQLQNSLKELKQRYVHHHVIICGDFNCQLGQSPCSTYLHYGSCPKSLPISSSIPYTEFGRPLTEEQISELDSDIRQHEYNFFSAYPMELVTHDPLEYITFVNQPMAFTVGLDQIWYHSENAGTGASADSTASIEVVGVRNPFHSPEHRQQILESGLPSRLHPSDHMPVGCILQWDVPTDSNLIKDLRSCDDHVDCFLDSTSTSSDGNSSGNGFGGGMSDSEEKKKGETLASEQIIELLAACPFTSKEQRSDFEFVISPVEGIPPDKGKLPTKDQILQVQQRRKVKKKLWEDVSDDVRKILERVIVLTREVSKCKK